MPALPYVLASKEKFVQIHGRPHAVRVEVSMHSIVQGVVIVSVHTVCTGDLCSATFDVQQVVNKTIIRTLTRGKACIPKAATASIILCELSLKILNTFNNVDKVSVYTASENRAATAPARYMTVAKALNVAASKKQTQRAWRYA